jgi:O-6-methylguanine DNA methyltransferase
MAARPDERSSSFDTEEARWEAIKRRNNAADGAFYDSVLTTGVYCRPSCASRPAPTASYSEIAERICAPKEALAVGEACAANMIAVVIPCHRVVRKGGALAGFRWAFNRKPALLKRERAQ